MSNTGEKLRAIFFAAIMVTSVFGMTVAFAGSAAAADGSASLDAAYYQDGDTVTVTIEDSDLNTDTGLQESAVVDITSTTEGTTGITSEDVADGQTQVTTDLSVATGADNAITGDITYNNGGDGSGGIDSVSRNSDGTVTITLSAASDADDTIDYTAGETVLVTEDSQDDATFTGTTTVDLTDAVGTLHVADGDTVTTTYDDVSPGTDRTATATIDTVAGVPSIESASTVDNDNDGQVDQISVTLTEDVTSASLTDNVGADDEFDVTLNGNDIGVSGGYADSATTSGGDTTVTFNLNTGDSDLPAVDTAITPEVTLASGTITDTAGRSGPSSDTTVTASDGAQPVITGAAAPDTSSDDRTGAPDTSDDGTKVLVRFSEPVNGVDSAAFTTSDPTVSSVTHADGTDAAVLTTDAAIRADADDVTSVAGEFTDGSNTNPGGVTETIDAITVEDTDTGDGDGITGDFESPDAVGDGVTATVEELAVGTDANLQATHVTNGSTKTLDTTTSGRVHASFPAAFDDQTTTQDESSFTVSALGVNLGSVDYADPTNYLVEVSPDTVTHGDTVTIEGEIYRSVNELADDRTVNYALEVINAGAQESLVADSDTSDGTFIITNTFDYEDTGDQLKDYPDESVDLAGDDAAYVVSVGTATPRFGGNLGQDYVGVNLDLKDFNQDPSSVNYRGTGDVTGNLTSADGTPATSYTISQRDPSGTAAKTVQTAQTGEFGYTLSFNDAGQWAYGTDEGGFVDYGTIEVGSQEANVTLSANEPNTRNFQHTYTVTVQDTVLEDRIVLKEDDDSEATTNPVQAEGYLNVTGPFKETGIGANSGNIVDRVEKDVDGDQNDETVYFHIETNGNGEAAWDATPVGDSVDVELENHDDGDLADNVGEDDADDADSLPEPGVEVTGDAGDTPQSPDYVGSASLSVAQEDPVNILDFTVEDPDSDNFDSPTDDTTPADTPFDDTGDILTNGPGVIEVLPLQDNGHVRVENNQRIGDDTNQNLAGLTVYRANFQIVDNTGSAITPGTAEGDLQYLNVTGGSLSGGVTYDDSATGDLAVMSDSTDIIGAAHEDGTGNYFLLIRPTEVSEYPQNATFTVNVNGESAVTKEVPIRGLDITKFLANGDEVDKVPGNSTLDLAAQVMTDDGEFVNNGRVRVSQTGYSLNKNNKDARTSAVNINNGEYNFTDLEIGPRGIDGGNDGIGDSISELTFTAYQYNDTDGQDPVDLEPEEVTRATVETLDLSKESNMQVNYVPANTSEYAGDKNGTFTLTRGVEYDQIAFELTQDGQPVDLTEGIDGQTIGLNELANAETPDLVNIATVDSNGDADELELRFDTDKSNASAGYYVISDITDADDDANVSSTNDVLNDGDSFVFGSGGTTDAAAQPFQLHITTADLSDETAADTGTFHTEDAQVTTTVAGVAGPNVPHSATDDDDLDHNQADNFNTNTTGIETPTIGVNRTYRMNATVTDALGNELNGSAVEEVRVTLTDISGGSANYEMVTGTPNVARQSPSEVEVNNANGTFQFDIEFTDGDGDGLAQPVFEVEAQNDVSATPDGVSDITGEPVAQNPVVEVYDQSGADLPKNPSADSNNEVLAQDVLNQLRIEAFPADEGGFVLPDGIRYGITGPYAQSDVEGTTVLAEDVVTDGYDEGQLVYLSVTPTSTGTGLLQLRSDTTRAGGGTPDGSVTGDDAITKNVTGDDIVFDVLQSNLEVVINAPEEAQSGQNVTVSLTQKSTGNDLPENVQVSLISPDSNVVTSVQTNATGDAVLTVPTDAVSGTYTISTRPAGYTPASQDISVAVPTATVSMADQSYTNSTDMVTVASATYEGGDNPLTSTVNSPAQRAVQPPLAENAEPCESEIPPACVYSYTRTHTVIAP